MPGNYSINQRADGFSVDSAAYNADHQNHVDNLEPAKMDDYSSNLTQMQTATDPGELGTESLPTSLAGELERMRYAIKEMKGTAQWYQTAAASLAALNTSIDADAFGVFL